MKEKLIQLKLWFLQLTLFKKILYGLPIGFFALSVFFYLAILIGVFGPVPKKKDLQNLDALLATKVIGIDNKLIGKLYELNRTYVPIDSISPFLLKTLVAVEDKRFYEHGGIDWRGTFRAIFKTVLLNKDAGGGSTLSQQLVKNVFGRKLSAGTFSIYVVKVKELIGSRRLEKIYEKDKILELYLNTVPFGENVYGIEAAADRFFSKHPIDLLPEEAAVLIGLLKANTSYNPRLHPDASFNRRNTVLLVSFQQNIIDKESYELLVKKPLALNYNTRNSGGNKPHYLVNIQNQAQELLKDKLKSNGEPYNVKTDGLKIFTTHHSAIQEYAEKAVLEHLKSLQSQLLTNWGNARPWGKEPGILKSAIESSNRWKSLKEKGKSEKEIDKIFKTNVITDVYLALGPKQMKLSPLDSVKNAIMILKCGFLVIDNHNGNILAWVGSPDYNYFQYDYVTSKRQAASTFKPVVYLAALQKGYKPCDFFNNEKTVYTDYENWEPRNFDNVYGGKYSMAGALAKSVNVVAVDLLYKSGGPVAISDLCNLLGIESKIPEFPSSALGVANISLLEMVQAYSTFANNGTHNKPQTILKIQDRNGKVIWESEKQNNKACTEDEARLMVEMLKGVVEKGTAIKLRQTYKLNQEIGGKTGTSQNYSDGWFIGFNERITAGVWVGADQPSVRFRSSSLGSGSNMAMPVFALFFKQLAADQNLAEYADVHFPELSEKLENQLDCADYRDKNDVEKFFDIFKNKERSDSKINRKNKTKKFWKDVLGI